MNQNQLKLIEILKLGHLEDKEKAWKIAKTRLIALGFKEVCGRCGGTGEYSYNRMYGTICFGCDGQKYNVPKLTKKLLAEVQQAVDAGKLDEYIEEVNKRLEVKRRLIKLEKQLENVWEYSEIHQDYDKEYKAKFPSERINPIIYMLQDQMTQKWRKFRDTLSKYKDWVNQGKDKEHAQFLLEVTVEVGEQMLKEMQELDEAYKAIKNGKIGAVE